MEKTKIVNDPQQLTLFGERTPRAVIYRSESHKLHQAFNVKAGEKIAPFWKWDHRRKWWQPYPPHFRCLLLGYM